jgi:hypothetical protein
MMRCVPSGVVGYYCETGVRISHHTQGFAN